MIQSDHDDTLARAISALTPWHQQYKRMMRWRARLDEPTSDDERRRDDFYAFFVVAYHMADWIKNDDTIDKSVRDAAWASRRTGVVALAGDVANGFKHLAREPRRENEDAGAHVSAVGGLFDPDIVAPGWTQSTTFVIAGQQILENAYTVADRCIGEWDAFLHEHGLTPPPP